MDSPTVISSLHAGLTRGVAEQALSLAVEYAPNGVALTTTDGRIAVVNAEMVRMFGYTREELLESPIERLIPERFRPGHAQLRNGDWKDFKSRTMGAGRELFGQRSDGSEFPIEIGVNVLRTLDDVMVIETIVDISVRKRMERMFQKTFEAAPYGMVMIDSRGRIVLINPQTEALFGYTREELIGMPLEMLLPERLRALHGRQRDEFTAAPSMRQMGAGRDLTARRKDGSEFPVEIGLNPVPSEEGGLVLAAVTDITHRRAMELELRQANANLEEFSYAASHDLKSPLKAIADLVDWIVEDLGSDAKPEVTRNLGRVIDRIGRLNRVIDDLLTYAHAGAKSTVTKRVEPRELLAGVWEFLAPPESFVLQVAVDAGPFVTAQAPLETVLRNLIGNAIKHHDRDTGSIEVRVEDRDQFCVFTIADDGPGIPGSAQERIFRMFQTLSSDKPGHSGIGLALSKRMVESHGGRIKVISEDGRRGTQFQVWWPRFQWSAPT